MITLKILPQATAQQVFDQVTTHLLKQGGKSLNGLGKCCYRAGDLKCAAGCLIGDNEYKREFEGKSWTDLIMDFDIPPAHSVLINKLQNIHDYYLHYNWREEFTKVAKEFNLKY